MKISKIGAILTVSMILMLTACGGNNNNAQVDALQKQVEELQKQVQQTAPAQVQQTQVQPTQPQFQEIQNPYAQNQQGQNQQVQNQMQQPVNQGQVQQYGLQTANVSLEEAKQLALNHAGISAGNATFVKTMQDYDNGMIKWDIDFVSGNIKYEYDVSAIDGTILKFENQQVGYQGVAPQTNVQQGVVPQQGVATQQGMVTQQGMAQGIDVESAKTIATNHAGFTPTTVTFTKTKYDFDDGMALWEIEFVVNTNKYEYEVSAANGAIFKSKVESIYYD